MSRSNIITNVISLGMAAFGTWQNVEGKMRPFDNVLLYGSSISAWFIGKKDDTVNALEKHLTPEDRKAARNITQIFLDRVLSQIGLQVSIRDEQQPTRVDYGDRAISDRVVPQLTEIQPQDADNRAVAIEEARQLRRRFDMPARIDPVEHSQWAEWNDRATYDDITQG